MKIILFAHQNWGVYAVRYLARTNHEIVRVYTHPLDMDKYEKVWYDSVSLECKKYGIEVEERSKISNEDVEFIQKILPDVIFSIGWRRLIPKSIFEVPKYGTINLHDGLIPQYRGFAPINWAIINGEAEVGLTMHFIDQGADTGDIISQEKTTVNIKDSAFDVYKKLLEISPKMLQDTLAMIENENISSVSQQKMEKGFFCTRRFPDDGKINWIDDRTNIYNLIRALCDPYPNAFFYYQEKKILIKNAELVTNDYRGPPGRICSINDDGLIVTCSTNHSTNQSLLIKLIQIDDKTMKPKEYPFKLWENLS